MTDALLQILTYIGGFLFLIAIFAFSVWRALRRDREWPAIARSLGLSYAARDDAPLERLDGFKIVDAVRSRTLSNVLSGTRGWFTVMVADYKYSNELTGTVQRHGFTLCVLRCDRLDLPHFLLESRGKPRSMTLAPQLRRPDDDPEVAIGDDPGFARDFRLRTGSGACVLELLTPELRARISEVRGHYLDLEAKGGTLIATRRNWIAPKDAPAFLDGTAAIAEGLLDSARRLPPAC